MTARQWQVMMAVGRNLDRGIPDATLEWSVRECALRMSRAKVPLVRQVKPRSPAYCFTPEGMRAWSDMKVMAKESPR